LSPRVERLSGAFMTDVLRLTRNRARASRWALIALALLPTRALAEMPDAASLFDYGFKGFTVGAEVGLAVGYIATGAVYQKDEWRMLVVGMGVGALAGMTTGIVVAVADSSGSGSPMGYYVLRDAGYGTLPGALMGAVTGSLLWVANGTSKDVLKGAAFGTLFGAAAGIGYGVLEGKHGTSLHPVEAGYGLGKQKQWGVRLFPAPATGGVGLAAQLFGRFG
jgi:hypothetical protein